MNVEAAVTWFEEHAEGYDETIGGDDQGIEAIGCQRDLAQAHWLANFDCRALGANLDQAGGGSTTSSERTVGLGEDHHRWLSSLDQCLQNGLGKHGCAGETQALRSVYATHDRLDRYTIRYPYAVVFPDRQTFDDKARADNVHHLLHIPIVQDLMDAVSSRLWNGLYQG